MNKKPNMNARLRARIKFWAEELSLEITSISIRSTMRDWATKSSSGQLAFWALVRYLPERLQEYVIAREIVFLVRCDVRSQLRDVMGEYFSEHLFLENWLDHWLYKMAKGGEIGPYSQEWLDTGNEIKPHYFAREVLDTFRLNPSYEVRLSSLSGGVNEASYLQQYVPARGPNDEPAIMAISAHLDLLSVRDQRLFSRFELESGKFSQDIGRAILRGEWPEETDAMHALMAAIGEVNRIVAPERLFELEAMTEVELSKEFLPISHDSEKAFLLWAAALDKILSENLREEFFDRAGIPSTEDGKDIKSLARLKHYLRSKNVGDSVIAAIAKPMETVCGRRGKISHRLVADQLGGGFREKQSEMLSEAITAVRLLCRALGSSFQGNQYREPRHLSTPVRKLH